MCVCAILLFKLVTQYLFHSVNGIWGGANELRARNTSKKNWFAKPFFRGNKNGKWYQMAFRWILHMPNGLEPRKYTGTQKMHMHTRCAFRNSSYMSVWMCAFIPFFIIFILFAHSICRAVRYRLLPTHIIISFYILYIHYISPIFTSMCFHTGTHAVLNGQFQWIFRPYCNQANGTHRILLQTQLNWAKWILSKLSKLWIDWINS